MENEKVTAFINRQEKWQEEFKLMREIILKTGLYEDIKWGKPCYIFEDKNIVIIQGFKDYCAISFFKGVFINDVNNLLVQPTANMQAQRILKFTNSDQIKEIEDIIKIYIFEAIEAEKNNLKLPEKEKQTANIIEELQAFFDQDKDLETAFFNLTPGRQRQYTLFFEGAKQSKTRTSRIEKYVAKIKDNKGMND